MKLANTTFALLTAVAWSAAPAAATTTLAEYQANMKNAEAAHKIAKAGCDSLQGNAKDVCIEEAKGREQVAKAEATYRVAKEKCDDLAGNAKDVCVKEAHAAFVKAKADAQVARVSRDTRQQAAEAKREADYQLAIEKCDALAGAAKDSCVRNAKARLGRS